MLRTNGALAASRINMLIMSVLRVDLGIGPGTRPRNLYPPNDNLMKHAHTRSFLLPGLHPQSLQIASELLR